MATRPVCPCGSGRLRDDCDRRPLRVCVDCGRPFHAVSNAAQRCWLGGCRQARLTLMERHKKRRQRGSRDRDSGELLPQRIGEIEPAERAVASVLADDVAAQVKASMDSSHAVAELDDNLMHGNMRVVKSDADGVGESPSASEGGV